MEDLQGFVDCIPEVVKGKVYGKAFKVRKISNSEAMKAAYTFGLNS